MYFTGVFEIFRGLLSRKVSSEAARGGGFYFFTQLLRSSAAGGSHCAHVRATASEETRREAAHAASSSPDMAGGSSDGFTAAAATATDSGVDVDTDALKLAVAGVTKKRRIKHNHAAQDARKSQRRRLLAEQDKAPEPETGASGRRPSDT